MSSLNPEMAEQFAISQLVKIKSDEDREFNIMHTEAVVETALILSKGKEVDKDLLVIAGWLHDIGKSVQGENHAQKSVEILEAEGFELNENLKDCILNHGSSGNPQSEEAKIIQIADKLSVLHPELISILERYTLKKSKEDKEKDFEWIKKMANNALEFLDKS